METTYVASGGGGDSVIISAKLLNIIYRAHNAQDNIHYVHFESDKRRGYEKLLNTYWQLVQQRAQLFVKTFTFDIQFYPHGKFWDVVPRAVFNKATGLTTQVDNLCSPTPPEIVYPKSNLLMRKYLCIVADGGGDTRGFTIEASRQIANNFPDYEIVILGSRLKQVQPDRVHNLTGQTTIEQALEYVRGSRLVIGPDGLLTYFSTIYGVPTTIAFHEPQLAFAYCVHDLPQARANAFLTRTNYIHDPTTVINLAKELVA